MLADFHLNGPVKHVSLQSSITPWSISTWYDGTWFVEWGCCGKCIVVLTTSQLTIHFVLQHFYAFIQSQFSTLKKTLHNKFSVWGYGIKYFTSFFFFFFYIFKCIIDDTFVQQKANLCVVSCGLLTIVILFLAMFNNVSGKCQETLLIQIPVIYVDLTES